MTRPTCPHCRTPLPRCFCDLVVAVETAVEVIIWQHPQEVGHAKGTVPLLARCLTNSRLLVAETLSLTEFEQATGHNCQNLHLLFPASETQTATPAAGTDTNPPLQRLLVLDGTWRKARKLLHVNPWLNRLPRFVLMDPPPSRYHIRKAENPQQLSTLEAVCAALAQAENSSKNTQPLLNAFDQYVARLSFRPQNRPNAT